MSALSACGSILGARIRLDWSRIPDTPIGRTTACLLTDKILESLRWLRRIVRIAVGARAAGLRAIIMFFRPAWMRVADPARTATAGASPAIGQ